MTIRQIYIFLAALLVVIMSLATACGGDDNTPSLAEAPDLAAIPLTDVLGNGKPTLAEFGRGVCIPCKQMKPILEELAVEYGDELNVVIVEVDENKELTRYYQIMTIPTQIVFDRNGNRIANHIGLWPKDEIVSKLQELGML